MFSAFLIFINKMIPENKIHKKVSFSKDISHNPICDKRKTITKTYNNWEIKANIIYLTKKALMTFFIDCLTSFDLHPKNSKIKNQINKATSLVEKILNKPLILIS